MKKTSKRKELTAKQKKFAELYAASGNATQSAIGAGYSKKTACSIGEQNLRKLEIKNYLLTITEPKREYRIKSAAERQEWLSRIIDGEPEDWYVGLDSGMVDVKAKVRDRLKAAELLARMRGELLDKTQLQGELIVNRIEKKFDGS